MLFLIIVIVIVACTSSVPVDIPRTSSVEDELYPVALSGCGPVEG